jgi:hypothetical protein
MEILGTLSESRMFRSKNAVERITARQAVELLHMHICALTILRLSPASEKWAKDYARRTVSYGLFHEWKTNSTDLGILGWALLTEDVDFRLPTASNRLRERITLDKSMLERWVKSAQASNFDVGLTKRMFSRLDLALKIDDESLRAIRRLVQDWTDLDAEEAQLCTTRLLQLLRTHGAKTEILDQLNLLASQYGLELMGVCNPDTGECTSGPPSPEKPKKKGNFFATIGAVATGTVLGYQASKHFHKNVKEDATAGATSAAGIAPVVGALGGVQRRVMPTTIAIPDGETSKRKSTKKKPK